MARSRHSRRPRTGSRRRGNKGGFLKTALLGSAIALVPTGVLGIGGYFAYHEINKEQIDANYCFPREDQYVAAFFVDFSHTQETSDSQRRDLINALQERFKHLPPNGQLAVFTTARGGIATLNKPEFVLCKPATNNAELAEIEAPTSSKVRLLRQFDEAKEAFEARVDDLLARSVRSEEQAGYSPILEQMRGISRYDFGAPLSHITIYTDGINNSPAAKFCAVKGHLPSFERFVERPDFRQIAPNDFGGAEVDILLVEAFKLPSPGLDFCTHQELRDFWTSYFEGNGARSVRLTPLNYGSGD